MKYLRITKFHEIIPDLFEDHYDSHLQAQINQTATGVTLRKIHFSEKNILKKKPKKLLLHQVFTPGNSKLWKYLWTHLTPAVFWSLKIWVITRKINVSYRKCTDGSLERRITEEFWSTEVNNPLRLCWNYHNTFWRVLTSSSLHRLKSLLYFPGLPANLSKLRGASLASEVCR